MVGKPVRLTKKNAVYLPLASNLDAGAVKDLHHQLLEMLSTNRHIVLQGLEVERFTTQALQLMLATAKDAEAKKKVFAIETPSDVMTNTFESLGFGQALAEWRR